MNEAKDSMTRNQKVSLELIHYILNSSSCRENYFKPGLKSVVKRAIRHYPEITSDDKSTSGKLDMYLSHLKISERGAEVIDANFEKEDVLKLLQYEHIVPVSVTHKDLFDLGERPTRKDIQEILSNCEVVILSKEEAEVLDGRTKRKYWLDGKQEYGKGLSRSGTKSERLNSLKIEFDERYVNNTLLNKNVMNTNKTKKGKTKKDWKKASEELAEKIFKQLGEVTNDYLLNYTNTYIGLWNKKSGTAHTFIAFLRRENGIVMECEMEKSKKMDDLIKISFVNNNSYYGTNGKYKLVLIENDVNLNLEAIRTLAKNARREHDSKQ